MSIDVKDKELILEQLQRNISEKIELIFEYEENEIYELAYLIKWQIIEETIKEIAKAQRRLDLLDKLNEWIDYLNLSSQTQPKKINSFSIDSAAIPIIEIVLKYFDNKKLVNLIDLMNSNLKYRKKRNTIAHKFERFRDKSVYMDYSKKVDSSIDELIDALKSNKL